MNVWTLTSCSLERLVEVCRSHLGTDVQGAESALNHLIISTFPPCRDGIAKYAKQMAQVLEAQGHRVECWPLAIKPGDQGLNPHSIFAAVSVWLRGRCFDRVTLHYHTAWMTPGGSRLWRILSRVLWIITGSLLPLEVVCHEVMPVEPLRQHGWLRKALFHLDHWTYRYLWRSWARVVVHGPGHRRQVEEAVGEPIPALRVMELSHGAFFTPFTAMTREEARILFGLNHAQTIFVCIGFFGRHKGFDRAIRAWGKVTQRGEAALYVVGSPSPGDEDALRYTEELRGLCLATDGAHLVERYVEDEEFDAWLCAADWVVLPYRWIATSSVLARVKLFAGSVIAADLPSLSDGFAPGDLTFKDDKELYQRLSQALGTGVAD